MSDHPDANSENPANATPSEGVAPKPVTPPETAGGGSAGANTAGGGKSGTPIPPTGPPGPGMPPHSTSDPLHSLRETVPGNLIADKLSDLSARQDQFHQKQAEIEKVQTEEQTKNELARGIMTFVGTATLLSFFFVFFLIILRQVDIERMEFSRGLITVLFAVGTMSIMVVIVGSVLISGGDFKERFSQAKEILTLLIGIFGTILGFYFGSKEGDDKKAAQEAAALKSATTASAPATVNSVDDKNKNLKPPESLAPAGGVNPTKPEPKPAKDGKPPTSPSPDGVAPKP